MKVKCLIVVDEVSKPDNRTDLKKFRTVTAGVSVKVGYREDGDEVSTWDPDAALAPAKRDLLHLTCFPVRN